MESRGFLSGSVVKNLPANPGDTGDLGSMIPCKRKWQPTPVFLPGGSRGQRSLAGYHPGGHQELDTTDFHLERLLFKDRLPRKKVSIPWEIQIHTLHVFFKVEERSHHGLFPASLASSDVRPKPPGMKWVFICPTAIPGVSVGRFITPTCGFQIRQTY